MKKRLFSLALLILSILLIFVLASSQSKIKDPREFTPGLQMTLQANTNSYVVTGYTGTSTEVIIPSIYEELPVTRIDDRAFFNCSNLTSIYIPNTVNSIGSLAFDRCSNLTNVYITDIAKWCRIYFEGDSANPLCTAEKLYLNGFLVTNLFIPDNVTSISSYAFRGYINLRRITIPDSVTSIGDGAFYNCYGLRSITLPDSITSIGDETFAHCRSLKRITIPDNVQIIGDRAFHKCSDLTNITIGNAVTSIGEWAFRDCSSLNSITIPNNVQIIGNNAFYCCTSLTSVTFEDPNNWKLHSHRSSSTRGVSISSYELADASTAAKKLKSIYSSFCWKHG